MRIRTAVTLIFHKVPVFVQIPGINKYIEKEPRTDQIIYPIRRMSEGLQIQYFCLISNNKTVEIILRT